MTIQHNITLDLVQPGLAPRIYAVQNDTNSRVVQITLTDKGQPWAIPADAKPSLSYRKSDGTRASTAGWRRMWKPSPYPAAPPP